MDLAALLAPLGVDHFRQDYAGRQPLHIPASPGAYKHLLDWPRLSELLAVASHWTPGNLALVLDRRAIRPDLYMDSVETLAGPQHRADPAKVEVYLGMGASLVANYVDEIAPELRDVTDRLGEAFAALTNANVYASFTGVQGFATHYDLHDVFAVQCEGVKTWRIYANRAENPVAPLATGDDAQAQIDANRGALAMTVPMRPGDVLYLPRGVYHDALAEQGASLHVSFSVAPHTGSVILKLLEGTAPLDADFRAFLADGRSDPDALGTQLQAIGARLQAIIASPGFRDEVIDAQRRRFGRGHRVRLPVPPAPVMWERTAAPAALHLTDEGAMLVTAQRRLPLGLVFAAADFALNTLAFSQGELAARFGHVPAVELDALLTLLAREGLVRRQATNGKKA
ncbi:MAG: JmjC domain-containing protein [Polymorphobacter sp.]